MLESLIITLREGIEAALIVGIVIVYLKKISRADLAKYVLAGVMTAIGLSAALAAMFQRIAINEEAYEGIVMLVAAVFVGSFMIWMHHHAQQLKSSIQTKVDRLLANTPSRAAAFGLFLFATIMVLREGVETVLFLSAISLTTSALWSFIGGILGLALATVFAVFFIKGSVRVDLPRFFRVTNIVLLIFIIQLLINAYHELSEAGILPTTPQAMATVGPIVRNNIFFVIAILGLPLFIFLTPDKGRVKLQAVEISNPAERRKLMANVQRQLRWQRLAGIFGMVILTFICLDFVYARGPAVLSPAEPVTPQDGVVALSISRFEDGALHRFSFTDAEKTLRFLVIKIDQNKFGVAFDACENCGDQGYYQEGAAIFCLNCVAEINPSTIGIGGGCNPIPLSHEVQNDTLHLRVDDLRAGMKYFKNH
ncbi:MAG: Fe-S-containing protein [candidate division KSB1 bacterium]|nr:Fe-S-containing protein [candidate division KSB1 bacterium]MDZ7367426.1 Fe-S-containing protein [candidate division KSB1 bacterium]MDZ7405469.1 Fe-S-containing protein [candidate division KSB1 bacterium]